MTLLLIRHGETPLNVARVLQPAATPLSATGQAQADALARWLHAHTTLRPAAIVSSDLPRALLTAQAIAATCGLPVLTTPLLHERNFGDLRGQPYDSLGFDPLASDEAPPGGESRAEFDARCAAAWGWVLTQRGALGAPLAVVSHGLVIKHWLHAGGLQWPAGLAAPDRLANTSLSVVDAAPPFVVRQVDSTAHLEGGVGEDTGSLSGG